MLGSIRIVFYRAERKARAKAKWDTGMLPNPLETLSESQLKGSDVGHNIRFVPVYSGLLINSILTR